ncbi:MAG TPA: hypothetical protein PLK31_10760 [Chloroflexota bacterium]|nr:hypothetical protein [Chloroflexota bacterium]
MHLLKDGQPLICVESQNATPMGKRIIYIVTPRQILTSDFYADKHGTPKSNSAWGLHALLLSEVVSTAARIGSEVTVFIKACDERTVECHFDTEEIGLKFYNTLLETIAQAKFGTTA